ncbi:MAG: GNAT family N-acetyltransferase [Bacteroidetes bacterium]|nr:GNAT family N-acetyltransferase [Bacteroidota bacterium]
MIEGPNLFLRALEPEDIDLLYRWENDFTLWHYSNTITPFSRFTLEQYVMNSNQDIFTTKQLRLMIVRKTEPGNPIGTIDLFDFDPIHLHAGVGIMLMSDFRKKGLALESLQILTRYAFNILHLHQLFCNITTDNEASLRLFGKSGFEITGTKKEWTRVGDIWKDEYTLQLINPLPN